MAPRKIDLSGTSKEAIFYALVQAMQSLASAMGDEMALRPASALAELWVIQARRLLEVQAPLAYAILPEDSGPPDPAA